MLGLYISVTFKALKMCVKLLPFCHKLLTSLSQAEKTITLYLASHFIVRSVLKYINTRMEIFSPHCQDSLALCGIITCPDYLTLPSVKPVKSFFFFGKSMVCMYSMCAWACACVRACVHAHMYVCLYVFSGGSGSTVSASEWTGIKVQCQILV